MYLLKFILVICCLAFGYAKPTQPNTNVSTDPHAKENFPDDVCRSMDAGNNHNQTRSEPQSTTPPYSVTTSKTLITSGEQLEVTIKGDTDDDKVLGFFIQGRPAGSVIADGKFIVSTDNVYGRTTSCFGLPDNAVIFKRQRVTILKSVTFTWEAPNVAQVTEYTFVVTVYKGPKTYWTNVISNKVNVNPK